LQKIVIKTKQVAEAATCLDVKAGLIN